LLLLLIVLLLLLNEADVIDEVEMDDPGDIEHSKRAIGAILFELFVFIVDDRCW
jgi:hypothetical protein